MGDGIRKETDSFVNGTNDREAYPKRWIAALVQANCERKTATKLGKVGYETYIPTQQEIHQWSDRKKKIERLIIPMIILVRATEIEEKWLREQTYIFKLLALPGSNEDKHKLATPIPDDQVERLKLLLQKSDNPITLEQIELIDGDEVEIIEGPLEGITGYVESTGNLNMLLVDIGLLGCARVRMEKSKLRKI